MKYIVPNSVKVIKDDDEYVLLNMKTGKFFGLDSVGSIIWELLVDEKQEIEIINKLCQSFNVNKEVVKADVASLINKLIREELMMKNE